MARCQLPHISAGRGGGLYVTVRWCPQAVPKTIRKLTAAHTPPARGWLRMIGLTACTTPAARNGRPRITPDGRSGCGLTPDTSARRVSGGVDPADGVGLLIVTDGAA
jgi:hypothetical protein